MERKSTTVLWAVDPFSTQWKLQRTAAIILNALSNRLALRIQPVYVAENPLPHLEPSFVDEAYEGLILRAQDRLDEITEGINLQTLLPFAMLKTSEKAEDEHASRVLAYGKEIGAEMIVAGTRARKGLAHWLHGSFSETLGLQSDIPVMIVNPSFNGQPWSRYFNDIFFPTDLSSASHEAFLQLLGFAKKTGSQVHLFHHFIDEPTDRWTLSFDSTGFNHALMEANKTIQTWENEARGTGVIASSEISTTGEAAVASAILRRTQLAPCVIAMTAQRGRHEANALGSATRAVIRGSQWPVWVMSSEPPGESPGSFKNLPQEPGPKNYRYAQELRFFKGL